MDWSKLAEARIEEWLRTPVEDRRVAEPMAPPRPLELDLLERLERSLREARTADPVQARAAEQRARDLETQLFALLDATGRSVLAPMMAERVLAIRRGDAD